MTVHWTNKAINDLLSIYEYIGKTSPKYADRIVEKLTRRTQQIEAYPRSGRMVPEYENKDLRELIENPYRIIYRVKKDQVDVLTVIHGRRQMPLESQL